MTADDRMIGSCLCRKIGHLIVLGARLGAGRDTGETGFNGRPAERWGSQREGRYWIKGI